jgi:tetratricopeptide (TPR) repeat protein
LVFITNNVLLSPFAGKSNMKLREVLFSVLTIMSALIFCLIGLTTVDAGDFQASNEWFSMGKYYLNFKKDEKKALHAFEKALEADADNYHAAEMVTKLREKFTKEKSVPVKTIHDKSKQWYHNALYVWNNKRDLDAAVICLKKALEINPYNADAAALMNRIKLENNIDQPEDNRPKVRITDKKGIIKKKQKEEEAYKYVITATLNYKKAEYNKALGNVEKALKISPDLKQALEFRKKIEKALADKEKMRIKHAVNRATGSSGRQEDFQSVKRAEHWYWLGKYYFDVKKEYPKALECFERAKLLAPDNDLVNAMINRSKLKLYFVSDSSAVKIVDTRKKTEKKKNRIQAEIKKIRDDSAASASDDDIKAANDPEKLKNDPEYKKILKEEEVILVSDYDLEPDQVEKEVKQKAMADSAEKKDKQVLPELSHYDKWKRRRLDFSTLTATLFKDFWKDSQVTDIIDKTQSLKDPERRKRKKNLESELEAIWSKINKKEEELKRKQSAEEKKRLLAEKIKRQKAEKARKNSFLMNSVSGLALDSLLTPEQIAREQALKEEKNKKEVKSSVDPDTVEEVKKALKEADNLLKKGKKDAALEVCRQAFNMVLQVDETNAEALFNLLLLYERTENYDFATLIFFKLLTILDTIKPDTDLNRAIRSKVLCNVKSIIIQSSVAAFNNMEPDRANQMGPGILSLAGLRARGLLATGDKPYELKLKLFDKTVKVDISVQDFDCPEHGGYKINSRGIVTCSRHGISSYILMHQSKKVLDF